MVRIPDYQAQQGLQIGGGPSLPGVDTTGARALQSVGGAIANLGGALQGQQDKLQDDRDKAWFSKARADASVGWTERKLALKNGATGTDAAGFTDLAGKEWGSYRAGVAKGAPSERAKGMFDQWADAFGANDAVDSLDFREKSLFAARGADFESAFEAHKKSVVLDPKQYDRAVALFEDDLEIAKAWMTPEQERAARDKGLAQLQSARIGELVRSDPAGFLASVGGSAVENTVAKIIGVESGGRADAKNPRSSASGLGQFTDSTWLATVRKHRPDLAGASNAELLRLKTDPTIGRQMTTAHTQENAVALAAAGHATTEGNLYLAHFAGIAGAKRVLAAADGAPIVSVLGADAVRANPFLRDQNIGWLKGWAAKKMGGQAPAPSTALSDPRMSHLTADQLVAYRDDAASLLVKQETAQAAAMKAAYNSQINTMMTGILDGTVGRADVQAARSSGWLTDYGDIKKAIDAIDTRDKATLSASAALAAVSDPARAFNPFNSDDKKTANTAFDAMGGATGVAEGDAASVQRVRSLAGRVGFIPDAAVDALRFGMGNSRTMLTSYGVLDGLYRENPQAVARSLTEADLKRLQDYQGLAPISSPEELRERLNPNMDPQEAKRREFLRGEGQKLARENYDMGDVLSLFDRGWFGGGTPSAPMDPSAATELRLDFEKKFAERYSVVGDEETAKTQAVEALQQRKWGVTDVGTTDRMVAYPPERFYPAVNGSHSWMNEQVQQAITAKFGPIKSFSIVKAPETEAAVNAGKPPPYLIVAEDRHGILRTGLAAFDPTEAEKAAREGFARERTEPNPFGNETQQQDFKENNPARRVLKAITSDPTGAGSEADRRDLQNAMGGIDRDELMLGNADLGALRAGLSDAQQSALRAAVSAISKPGVDRDAITTRLRSVGVPEELWPQ